jgi:protein-tyrosine phosphatase
MNIDKFTFTKGTRQFTFHIGSAPSDNMLEMYIKYFSRNKIVHIFRFCDNSSCDESILQSAGFKIIDLPFDDGGGPPINVRHYLDSFFNNSLKTDENVYFHCVAGLGRAPTCMGYVVCKYIGVDPLNFITLVRKKRAGAFNKKQLYWLQDLTPYNNGCCVIS